MLVFALRGTLVSFILEKTIFPNSNWNRIDDENQLWPMLLLFLNILQCYITTALHVLFAWHHKLICFSRFPNRLLALLQVPPCIQLFAFVISVPRAYINRIITKLVHAMPEKNWNGLFILKTHHCFFVYTAPKKFQNPTFTGHFGFLLEENSMRKARISKCFSSTETDEKPTFSILIRFEGIFNKLRFRDWLAWRISVTD